MRGSTEVGEEDDRWKEQIEEALSSIDVTNWRRRVKSRGDWKDVFRQAGLLWPYKFYHYLEMEVFYDSCLNAANCRS